MEERRAGKHKLIVENRETVMITGVVDVISFDEEQIIADTDLGVMVMKGYNLHVNNLNLDSGTLEVFGEINSISYEEKTGQKVKNSFIGKIFK